MCEEEGNITQGTMRLCKGQIMGLQEFAVMFVGRDRLAHVVYQSRVSGGVAVDLLVLSL